MKESNNSPFNRLDIIYTLHANEQEDNLLLLHGFLGSKEIWDPMLAELSKRYNILTLDFPGHGESPCEEETLTMKMIADQIADILESEDFYPAHIVGHSMGGYVGLELLNGHPEMVASFSLLNSTAMADSEEKKIDRLRAVRVFDLSPRTYIREAVNNLFHQPNLARISLEVNRLQEIALNTTPEGAKACLRGMRERTDHTALVNNTSIPIQYIAGVQDNTIRYQTIKEQIKSQHIQLVSFENSGHMSFAEERELCLNAITDFISTL